MARPGVSAGSPYDYLLLAVANRVARLLGGSIQPITGTSGSGLALDLPCVSPADPVLVFKQESPSSSPMAAKNSPPMPKFLGEAGAAVLMRQVDEEDDGATAGQAPVLRRSSQPPNTRKRSSISSTATATAAAVVGQAAIRLSPASSHMAPPEVVDVGGGGTRAGAAEAQAAPPTALMGASFMEAMMSVAPMSVPKPSSGDASADSKSGQETPVTFDTENQVDKQQMATVPQPTPASATTGPDASAMDAPANGTTPPSADTQTHAQTGVDVNGNPQQVWICPPDDVLVPPKKKHERQVLVVEDDMINQRIIRAMLTKLGYKQITFAADGADALFHYNSMKEEGKYFDIILLDQSLPSLSGDDTCARIRRNDRTQVIISCSANAQLTADPELCRALGYDEAINKPIYLDLLAEVLNRWTIAGDARRLRHTKRKLKHEAIAAGLAVTTASFAATATSSVLASAAAAVATLAAANGGQGQ
ncbi:hypothetical protein BCR44DRAFT_62526 [Catenaria anguillulae PL171]|uniref:Response regulatory domain-containing protein n=1 Tax=Catenaria anguillulae PL171 TaxID=765915 RepID=A0A1Y2HRV0_9FUNG|nr:hypothetical protein BCR44DRAFT_62526 [Catenaria anguillulae PL171]